MKQLIDFIISPLTQGIVGAIVGAILALLFQRLKQLIDLFPSRRLLKTLIPPESNIYIAIASIELKEFSLIMGKGKADLPTNVNLIGLHDALGAAYLQDSLKRLFRKKNFTLCSADSFTCFDGAIITLGGSSVNRITHALLDDRKLDKSFEVKYPEHFAVDHYEGQDRRFDATVRQIDKSIVEDYSFILVAPSPFNLRRKVCVLQGLWPYGTWGAIYAMINPRATGLYKAWKKLKNRKKGFLAILTVPVADDFPGIPRLVSIREIDLPN